MSAKRYLTAKKPVYHKRLSTASKGTLDFQGGPMSESECQAFEQHPLFIQALQVRANDEKGKINGLDTPSSEDFIPLIDHHLTLNTSIASIEKHLFFVRHAEAEGQAPEAPLTPAGQHSVTTLAKQFENESVDMIIASPFLRAQQTAQGLADALGQRVFTDHRLHEVGDHVNDKDLLPTIISALEDIQKSVLNNYIIVGHGHWLSVMINHLFPEVPFTGVSQLQRPHIIKVTLGPQKKTLEL